MSTSAPQSYGRLSGGSAAQEHAENNGGSDLVQDNVKIVFPSPKRIGLTLRIKPAHDERQLGQPSFPTSVVPYRTAEIDEDGHRKFSSWFQVLRAYQFLGNSQMAFVSPITRPQGDGVPESATACPMVHMYRFAKNNPQWAHLTVKPEQNQAQQAPPVPGAKVDKYPRSVLRQPDSLYVMNVDYITKDNNTPQAALFPLSRAAFEHYADQLNAYMPQHLATALAQGQVPGQIADTNWPTYMLGDVTDPRRGQAAWMQKVKTSSTSNAEPWCLLHSSSAGNPNGLQAAWPIGDASLAARYDLLSDSTFRILSYQDLVDRILADGAFPRELVAAACGHMANIPGGSAPTGYQQVPLAHDHIPGLPPSAPAYAPLAPAQSYAPPAQSYSPPAAQQFGGPPQGFGGPPQGFGGPPAAAPSYGPPAAAPQFGGPPQGFGGPPQGFGGSPQGFGGPPQGFGGPPQGSGPPMFGGGPPPQLPAFPVGAPQSDGTVNLSPSALMGAPPALAPTHNPLVSAPPVMAPPAAPPAPAPAGPDGETLFWVAYGGATQPQPSKWRDIQASSGAWPADARFKPVHEQSVDWAPLSKFQPAASAPPAAPAAPPAYVPPSGGAPNLTPLSAEEIAAYKALTHKLTTGGAPDPDDLARLGAWTPRAAITPGM